ncbi:peptidoglycan DD-metalloendopeptidase family protein [Luteimonas saliphila]|uniref:peptidoglycan DD-metalloendopeptidase family protein n=1 Tax=Luteimonas saliphila TaxID=2804919 RepID=UPI00192D9C1E|nr:peptidoglycan DD-metalloendopeptidase family protein [Luteimonas saliphila]
MNRPSSSLPGLCLGACMLLALGHARAEDHAPATATANLAIAPMEKTAGIYRIPYADGTRVRIGRDHNTHTPKGRYDMNGQGGGTYRIVAAADGYVTHIEDRYSARLDCKDLPDSEKKNNYVWIRGDNDESIKYSHARQGSSTGKAKLKVGQFVTAGTYLGDEGDVGCAGGPHLHVEAAVLRATDPITEVGGFVRDNAGSKRNRVMRVCGAPGGVFAAGQTLTARKVPGAIKPGAAEVARHGVPAGDYQCLFDQAVASGYMPEWIDGFEVGGKGYYNVVFRPKGGTWAAFHGLTGSQYQQRFDQYQRQGYRPHQVESYPAGGGVRYAVIFRKQAGPQYAAYHGLSAAQHQQRLNALTGDGYRPRNVSVVSSGGERRYTALFDKSDLGSWQSKSQLSAAEYQQAFDDNAKHKRQLVYLNSYTHGGQPYFSAIWSSKPTGTHRARHGLTSAQYQSEWQGATGSGLRTRAVTGYGVGNSPRYAAFWSR